MNEQRELSVGFIGVGAIAAAVATAILEGPTADTTNIVLSPRSAARSKKLETRYRRARVASDNQAVVDGSDVVVVAVLPDQVVEVCSPLTFRSDQVVVGLPAGWPPARLAEHVAPAETICQLIPLPMITLGVGPLVLYPKVPEIEQLLSGCGTIVIPEREEDIAVLNCASAIMSSFFAFQNAAVEWTIAHGLDRSLATRYVTAQLHGLATEAMATDPAELPEAIVEHETPGGLNEYIRKSLAEQGFFTGLGRHLEQIHSARFPA